MSLETRNFSRPERGTRRVLTAVGRLRKKLFFESKKNRGWCQGSEFWPAFRFQEIGSSSLQKSGEDFGFWCVSETSFSLFNCYIYRLLPFNKCPCHGIIKIFFFAFKCLFTAEHDSVPPWRPWNLITKNCSEIHQKPIMFLKMSLQSWRIFG